jgi:hypothetical protein
VDGGVGLCGVATSVFIYYYMLLLAKSAARLVEAGLCRRLETDFLVHLDGLAQSL